MGDTLGHHNGNVIDKSTIVWKLTIVRLRLKGQDKNVNIGGSAFHDYLWGLRTLYLQKPDSDDSELL